MMFLLVLLLLKCFWKLIALLSNYHNKTYKQICIIPEHIHKTVFATVLGTFRSQVMQMGDCNAPSTFQRLMTAIFRDCISWFIHVYLDDIFIYSHSIEEHEQHLGIVFQQLRDHHLFLSKSKVDLYSKRLECLSHITDDRGIHVDADKMPCICEWRCPRTFNDVQRFLGLVQYLAHYMPDISAYTTPLSVWGLLKVFLPKACAQQSLCRWSIAQSFKATAIGSVTRGKLDKYEKECDVWCVTVTMIVTWLLELVWTYAEF